MTVATTLITDFEDQDTDPSDENANWSRATQSGATTVSTSGLNLEGNYCLELEYIDSTDQRDEWTIERDSDHTEDVRYQVRVDRQSGSASDWHYQTFSTVGNTDTLVRLYWRGDGSLRRDNPSGTEVTTWSADTTYTVHIQWDFANNEYTLTINGTDYGPFGFYNSNTASGWGRIFTRQLIGVTDDTDTTAYNDIFETLTAPDAPANLTATATDDDIDLSWDDVDGEDGYNIYRATSSGSTTGDYTQIDSVGAGVTTYSDTGLLDGEQFFYRVTAHNSLGESGVSNEDSATTTLPAPSGLTVTAHDATSIDVSWTDNSDNEDGFKVFKSTDGGSSFTEDADLAPNTTTHTFSGLRNGEQYTLKVQAYTEHVTAESGTVQQTTDLPDVGAPSLGNGVEDEVEVTWTDVINYGSYRIEYRETGASTWIDDGTEGEATTSHLITGLEDGEEYEVRIRTETEHVDGAWTSPVSIVTKFPAATNLSTSNVTTSSLDLSWTDNSDNEDGFKVRRRRKYDGSGSFGPWSEIADLAPNTTSYSDSGLSPGTTYEYLVRGYTEHTTADSGTVSVTTASLGLPRSRTGSRGWVVEVDHPDGRTLRPTIVGEPQRNPKANDYPTISTPVRRDEAWQNEAWEDQSIRVWFDGERQPIDELESVEMTPGATVLAGRGGVELETHVSVEYDVKKIHLAAQDLVDNNTSYTSNVDAPNNTVETNQTVQSADSTSEFTDALADPIGATDPFEVASGEVHPLQTCFTEEGENFDSGSDSGSGGIDAAYSDGAAATFGDNSGGDVTYNFTTDYTIPKEDVELWLRVAGETTGNGDTEIELFIDGESLGSRINFSGSSLTWSDYLSLSQFSQPSSDLSSGSHTLRINTKTDGADLYAVDVVAPLDGRYSYTFDNDNGGSSGYLDGPELYPDAVDVEFADVSVARSVSGGRIESTWDDTTGSQAVALSNDKGVTYPLTSSNTDTHEADFADLGPSLRWRATLSRYGSRSTATPQTGFNGQSVESFTLKADLDDTPLVVDQSFDGQLMGVLQELADQGDFVFAYQRDGSTESVEWTQVGQRSSSKEPSVATYDVSKTTARIVEKVNVEGSSLQARDEPVTANHGTFVDLANDNLQSARERVESGGTVYQRDVDYEMDYDGGRIKTLAGGDITDGGSLSVDYRYKPHDSYTASGVASPREDTFTIPGLTTERACGLVARRLVEKLKDPRWEAQVVIPHDEAGWSVVDDITLPQVPTGGARHINEVENVPGQTVLQLASRESVGAAVEDIRRRVRANAQKV